MDHHLTMDYETVRSLLCTSIEGKHYNVVRDILINSPLRDQLLKSEPEFRKRGNDPLYWAIETNEIDIVQLFLDLGTKIDSHDYELYSHIIRNRRMNILKLFIDRGLDLFIKTDISVLIRMFSYSYYFRDDWQEPIAKYVNKYSESPSICCYLMFSCLVDNIDAFKYFIASGLDIECVKHDILLWSSLNPVIGCPYVVLCYILENMSYEEEPVRDLINTNDLFNHRLNKELFKYINYIDTDAKIITYGLKKMNEEDVKMCIQHNTYTSIQQSDILQFYMGITDFDYYGESTHLSILKLFVSGGFELSEIADDLILNSFVSKYFKIIDYLKEIKVDMRGALEKIVEKLSKVAL